MPEPVVCMIRGVNVGGKHLLKMDLLRSICSGLGFREVQTILQSGNVVFLGDRPDPAAIEAALKKQAGLEVKVFLRTPAELRKTIAANPFPEGAERDPSHMIVMFFDSRPPAAAQKALRDAYSGPEPMHFAGRELFIDYGEAMGSSKLNNALIERKLGMPGTARNWKTVGRLLAAADSLV